MKAFIGLGSNLGDRRTHIEKSILMLRKLGQILKVSSVHETDPEGYESSNTYLNAAVSIETELSPQALMEELLHIELELGRERLSDGYEDRTIDLDLLLYGDITVESELLQIPHPEMLNRKFVLEPLLELEDVKHPITGRNISDHLNDINAR